MSPSILSILFFGVFGSAAALGPPSVLLGTAGSFAILSQTGVSTVPQSSVNCDIGVSPIAASALTGFALTLDTSGTFSTSTQVNGKLYAASYDVPTPPMLTAAVADMGTAYTDAQGRPNPDSINFGSGSIGGAILVPGLYKFSTDVTVASNLALTGGPADTYLFQISGTLSLGTGASITLLGGLLPSNIVWAVAGDVTTGADSSFQGILLVQTHVAVGTNAVVNGRILSQTSVSLRQSTVIAPGACGATTSSTAVPSSTIVSSSTISSSTANPSSTAVPGQCYVDSCDAPILPFLSSISTAQTIPGCITQCAAGGYAVAGLSWGNECFCGNALSASAGLAKPQTECNMPCSGDAKAICGGGFRVSVYAVPFAKRNGSPHGSIGRSDITKRTCF